MVRRFRDVAATLEKKKFLSIQCQVTLIKKITFPKMQEYLRRLFLVFFFYETGIITTRKRGEKKKLSEWKNDTMRNE